MNRDFSKVKVVHTSRKNSLKRRDLQKRSKRRHLKTTQSNITRESSLNPARFSHVSVRRFSLPANNTNAIQMVNISKKNQIPVPFEDGKNQFSFSDFHHINSRTCFDLSNLHQPLSRNHRINPINTRDLYNDDFTIERNKKRKKKQNLSPCLLGLCILISLLLIGGIIAGLIYAFTRSKSSVTTGTSTVSSSLTATQNSACTVGGTTCSTPMLHWDRSNNCTQSSSQLVYFSCCYQATSTQLTIDFELRDDISPWYIDDVSITQGNGELTINGNFESNLTGWTVNSSSNPSTTYAEYAPGFTHSGLMYLHSEAKATIKQTVSVIQGQNVNITFWWRDIGGLPAPSELCEGTVSLIP